MFKIPLVTFPLLIIMLAGDFLETTFQIQASCYSSEKVIPPLQKYSNEKVS